MRKPREIRNVFFDLDGTLTDSQTGITRCLQYALERLGRPSPDASELKGFIGPPLRSIFEKLLGAGDSQLVEKAVEAYRERFSEVGLFENTVYPGIPGMLTELKQNSLRLVVVTTKPRVYAERIIAHYFPDKFEGVFGTELDGRYDNKVELVGFVLGYLKLPAGATAMVGDRKEDITAGTSNRTITVGVTYGYGGRAEINGAAPDYICDSPSGIKKVILKQ